MVWNLKTSVNLHSVPNKANNWEKIFTRTKSLKEKVKWQQDSSLASKEVCESNQENLKALNFSSKVLKKTDVRREFLLWTSKISFLKLGKSDCCWIQLDANSLKDFSNKFDLPLTNPTSFIKILKIVKSKETYFWSQWIYKTCIH